MKAVALPKVSASVRKLLKLAEEENLILQTPEGQEFVLAEIDDFAEEVKKVRQNKSLMRLLEERSKERGKHTLDQARLILRNRRKAK